MRFIEVSKEEFYAYVGPRDIVVGSYEKETLFKTRGGLTVGKTGGYKSDSSEYLLSEDALRVVRGEK